MKSHRPAEDELDLSVLVQGLWQRRLLILAVSVASAVAAAGLSLFILAPVYESRTQILLSEHSGPAYATPEAATRVLTGVGFLEGVARTSGMHTTGRDLQRKVRAVAVKDARIVDLRIRHGDPQELRAFANAIVQEFMKRASQRVKERRETAERRLAALDLQLNEVLRTVRVTRLTLERLGSGAPSDTASWFARSYILNSVGTSEQLYSQLLNAQKELRNDLLALEPPMLIQAPYASEVPVSPRPLLYVSAAATFGLIAAATVTFVIDLFRSASAGLPAAEGNLTGRALPKEHTSPQ